MNYWTALLPVAGVVVGALLQFWLSRAADSRKQLVLQRNSSYADYLRGVSNTKFSTTTGERANSMVALADAKARISVYGSAEVVSALASLERVGANLNNEESIDAFLAVAAAMRTESGPAKISDLYAVLMGPRPNKPMQTDRPSAGR